jgi:tripartite-type tricarboxylate transporter receptor subunit TctC
MRAAAVTLTAAAIALGSVAPVHAADWPAKPVRIVSPFASRGTSDTLARLLAGGLGERFDQIFFVENRGGAGGPRRHLLPNAAHKNCKHCEYRCRDSTI